MVKSALEKAAKELGHTMKVETQGASGLENKLTKEDIEQADVLILAVEVGVTEKERFNNIPKVTIPQKTVIKSPKNVLKQIEAKFQSRNQ
ncbi:MAG: PTS fructose transporter subunit IIB [Candidatus Izemoplasmataceae bacterium]